MRPVREEDIIEAEVPTIMVVEEDLGAATRDLILAT